MQLVRTSAVTDAKVGDWNWRRFTTNGSEDNRVIDGTSYRVQFDTFERPNFPNWFRVAAVGSDGLSGAWSAPVSYAPTALDGAANNVPNTPKAFNRTGSGGALAAPTGLAAVQGNSPRVASLTWNAVPGAEGYIVERSWYDPATQIVDQPYIELASDPTPILANDLVIIDKEYLTSTEDIFTPRIFGTNEVLLLDNQIQWSGIDFMKRDGNDWAYVPYSGDKPSQAVGDHFFRRIVAAGQTDGVSEFWHAGSGQADYNILKPDRTYRLRVVMRASAPTTVTFTPGGPTLTGTTFNVGTTFAEYTHDMVPAFMLTDSSPFNWSLAVTAGGSPLTLDVAYFDIDEVGATTNVLSKTMPAPGGYLRDHSFIGGGRRASTLKQRIERETYGYRKFHATCLATNSRPWFQMEWNSPKSEWLDFVAYLAAPNGSHPMAILRQASGIAEPWTTTFANIRLEMGNEAWNPIGAFWNFPGSMTDSVTGTVYSQGNVAGMFWQMISDWMKESPYWSILQSKLTQHCGGWTISNWGEEAYRYYPDAKEISVAAYTGGWDNGTELVSESGLSFQGVLAFSTVVHRPTGKARVTALKQLCRMLGRPYGTAVRYGMYEAGPGYQMNGLNGAAVTAAQVIEQEVVMKSRAAGVATVDTMLTYAENDYLNYNYFTMAQGNYWRSHALDVDGGQEYISHALVRIIHENIAPARVFGMDTTPYGLITVTRSNGSTVQIPQIGAYQLRNKANPSKRMIVLINRALDPSQLDTDDPRYSATPSGTLAFNLTTDWNSAASLKAWTAGVGPYRQHNRYPVGQRRLPGSGLTADPLCVSFNYSPTTLSVPANIKDFPIDASVGAAAGGLPAGSCLILLFEGVT